MCLALVLVNYPVSWLKSRNIVCVQDFINNRSKLAPACVRGCSTHPTPPCVAFCCLAPAIFSTLSSACQAKGASSPTRALLKHAALSGDLSRDCFHRYSYYSADDNALNESPLSLSQEKYNQLLGFTISSAIMSFALAIGCAKIYSRARHRYALVVPTESDHPNHSAPSFWVWLWRDLTSKAVPPASETQAKAPKPSEPAEGEQSFRRAAKNRYVQRAALTIDGMPPTPQAVAAALETSEYFRTLAQEERSRLDRLAQMARNENEELGLRVPSNVLRAPQELPPSHGRRQRGGRSTLPQPPTLPRPY